MRVALVTTWGTACGIAEHSAYLKAAVEQADPTIEIVPILDLHPRAIDHAPGIDVIWLNYHAALHSQWTPKAIRQQQAHGIKVGVTYHDTGVPNSDQASGICVVADAFVVHEPYDDLEGNGRYWRMGIPDWHGVLQIERGPRSWNQDRPILGTVGFPFPWKNYDELARVTAAQGWALFLIAPTATEADIDRWHRLNPHSCFYTGFCPREQVVGWLAACDATAFCYTCANTGQSGAVCQGIAVRKPVIAFGPAICRQFRALYADMLGGFAIDWAESFADVGQLLRQCRIDRCDPGIVALAEQDSWTTLGVKYATLMRELVG